MSLLKEIMWLFEIYCIKKGFEKCKVYKVNIKKKIALLSELALEMMKTKIKSL